MFWNKKKEEKKIKDPVTQYGELLRNNKITRPGTQRKKGLLDKIFKNGHDAGFVYYEE